MPLRTLLAFLLTLAPAFGNLGDTVEKCVQRYGKPVGYSEAGAKNPFGTLIFVAGGYQLVVFLSNGMEVGARVSKTNKSAFTDGEMQMIMKADSPASWVVTPSTDPTCLQWNRADKATALYDRDKKLLIFTSEQMATALHAASAPAPVSPRAPPEPVTPARPATP